MRGGGGERGEGRGEGMGGEELGDDGLEGGV